MFRSAQIITATELIKEFRDISRFLHSDPGPILITQRNGRHLVILDAQLFEEIVDSSKKARTTDSAENPPLSNQPEPEKL